MVLYNILTCKGFEVAGGYVASGGCVKARIGIVLLFFIIAIIRKWGGEEMGFSFNFIMALLLGIISYFLIITFTGSFKFAFGIGLILALVGGYFLGMIIGVGDDG